MSIIYFVRIRIRTSILSFVTFAVFGLIAFEPLQAKGFGVQMLDQNPSVSFNFSWSKIRIAEMSFSVTGENNEYWAISGKTLGPLRLVKNYQGEARQSYDADDARYVLEGRDQGFLEKREILFRPGYLPSVGEFIDRAAETSLTPELPWAAVARSPMGLFRQIINSTQLPSLCSGSIFVYDGKRAYAVNLNGTKAQERELRALDLSQFRDRVFWKCSAILEASTMINLSEEQEAKTKEASKKGGSGQQVTVDNDIQNDSSWSKVWFFGSRDRRVDFLLSNDCKAFELVGMIITSPVGRIIGKPARQCASL